MAYRRSSFRSRGRRGFVGRRSYGSRRRSSRRRYSNSYRVSRGGIRL